MDGGLYAGQPVPTPPADRDVSADPSLDLGRQLSVAQIVEPAPAPEAGTVTEHSHESHACFDAPPTLMDTPPAADAGHQLGPVARPDEALTDFLAVVDQHEQRIASVIARFLDDPRDIEEAVQDTFVQAWRHRAEFRGDAAVFTWLYRIATNTALMRLRRKRLGTVALHEVGGKDLAPLSHDPLDRHADRLAMADRIRSALADLPDHYRIAVLLRDVEGLSNGEVADLLGLPLTTVKAHLHRGRAALRTALGHG